MNYRRLGKWGAKVSSVALGSWLTYGNTVDEKAAVKQIAKAFELGINFFDTANVYAQGHSEVVVGKALKSLRRDSCFVATKVFFPMGEGPNDRGLSRKHVFEQCHASLKRLSLDYIDLYQCHRFDPEVPLEEIVATMHDLSRQGKILYWGVSEWSGSQIEEACKVASALGAMPPISNQPCYNMLTRNIEATVIPTCEKLGIGQVVFSPLAQGVLTGKYAVGQPIPEGTRAADSRVNMFMLGRSLMSDETLNLVDKLRAVAESLGISLSQLALAWCLRQSNVSSVIIGATRLAQIEENVKACEIKLDSEILARINSILGPVPAK
ncbi:MAG: aldo/keto reductase family protein [Candidatus Obscuribacter phosphatis]|uniref:Aldo/keto reductase family protein n=1 Tax=Candidatus Obscuribacter phosphatis TaxID=1906157 RepID=A0A8J7TL88_9BACT|nr:aldo/keto reductase family protein [Candidatus Obscuribacter phosphatis]